MVAQDLSQWERGHAEEGSITAFKGSYSTFNTALLLPVHCQNLATWPHQTSKEAGMCTSYSGQPLVQLEAELYFTKNEGKIDPRKQLKVSATQESVNSDIN